MKPLVSLIVLNYNGEDLIRECLNSLLALEYKPVEILVVDNGSTDNSLTILDTYGTSIQVIRNSANFGYAKGNNIGMKAANGKYVATVNNDIVVDKEWLNRPVAVMESIVKVGIICCRQMNYYNRDKIDVLFSYIADHLMFEQFGSNEPYHNHPMCYVAGASGASAIYRKKMLEKCGYFNERYFAYHEESDLCMCALRYSYKCVFVPEAVVYHKRSVSFNKIKKTLHFYHERNRYIFIFNNYPLLYILKNLYGLLYDELRRFKYYLMHYRLMGAYVKGRLHGLLFILTKKTMSTHEKDLFKKQYRYIQKLKTEKYIPF